MTALSMYIWPDICQSIAAWEQWIFGDRHLRISCHAWCICRCNHWGPVLTWHKLSQREGRRELYLLQIDSGIGLPESRCWARMMDITCKYSRPHVDYLSFTSKMLAKRIKHSHTVCSCAHMREFPANSVRTQALLTGVNPAAHQKPDLLMSRGIAWNVNPCSHHDPRTQWVTSPQKKWIGWGDSKGLCNSN
jgi:hypothetical protein